MTLSSASARVRGSGCHLRRSSARWGGSAVIFLLAAAAGTLLAGCDKPDGGTGEIRSTSIQMHGLSGGAVAPSDAYATKVYQQTVSDLQTLAGAGTPQAASAGVLTNYAKIGLAFDPAREEIAATREAMNRTRVILSVISDYQARRVSERAAQFDPAPQLAEIAALQADKRKEIEDFKTRKADVDRRVAELRAQAKAKLDEAAKYAEEFAQTKQDLSRLTATEAQPRLEAAHKRMREGDAIRVAGDRLAAQADTIEPESRELELMITTATQLVESLDQTALGVRERAQQQKAAAAGAADKAREAAAELDKQVTELDQLTTSQILPKQEAVIATLRQAVDAARKGGNDAAAKLATGRAQQALGDAHLGHAAQRALHANLLEALAALEPALPQRDTYASAAATARAAEKEALAAAGDAYESAQSAFASVNIQKAPDAKERLERLAERLGALAVLAKGKPAAAAATDNAPPTDSAPPADGATPTEGATPDAAAPAPASESSGEPAPATAPAADAPPAAQPNPTPEK